MASNGWVRREKSGRWAATVYTPAGRRRETFDLKKQAEDWADDIVKSVRDQEFVDPKGAKNKVGECWTRFKGARKLARASRLRDESHWRKWVEPYWGDVPIGAVTKPDVMAWMVELEEAGVGPATIQAAVGVLRAILELCVDAKLIKFNVASTAYAPGRPAHHDRVLDEDEDEVLLANADARFPDRPFARLFLELLLTTGLRYEEGAAIDRDHVDMKKRLVHIVNVMEKNGAIRPHPKSKAGIRHVPIDDELWPRFRAHVLTVKPSDLAFRADRGGLLRYDNYRDRVWLKVLTVDRAWTAEEIEAWKVARIAAGERPWKRLYSTEEPVLFGMQPTLHDLRHTYGTRLAEGGVEPHEIMALMGHETLESVQRYLHAREGRFDKAREAMRKARERRST